MRILQALRRAGIRLQDAVADRPARPRDGCISHSPRCAGAEAGPVVGPEPALGSEPGPDATTPGPRAGTGRSRRSGEGSQSRSSGWRATLTTAAARPPQTPPIATIIMTMADADMGTPCWKPVRGPGREGLGEGAVRPCARRLHGSDCAVRRVSAPQRRRARGDASGGGCRCPRRPGPRPGPPRGRPRRRPSRPCRGGSAATTAASTG